MLIISYLSSSFVPFLHYFTKPANAANHNKVTEISFLQDYYRLNLYLDIKNTYCHYIIACSRSLYQDKSQYL